MTPLKTALTVALLSLGMAAIPTAHAQKTSKRGKKAANTKPKKGVVKKAKSFDFMADDITADRIRPDGTAIFGLQSVDHKSLIRIRSEFIAEIVKSAEML